MPRRRSKLVAPGGFSIVQQLPAPCHFCGAWGGWGWINVAAQRVVCGTCLPDPWAQGAKVVDLSSKKPMETHYAGERAAEQLRVTA
jgi:hypothetical protein